MRENTTKQVNECLLPVEIAGNEIYALIDSGATHSIVGDSLFKKIPHLKGKLKPVHHPIKARAVNGNILTYKEQLQCDLTIKNYVCQLNCYYSPMLCYDIILGYDFLKKARLVIDFGTLEVKQPSEYVIKAAQDIHIQPTSEVITWGKLTGKLSPGNASITTHKTLQNMGYTVANELIDIDENKPWVPIRILNPFRTTALIKNGTRLAIAERLRKADIIHEQGKIQECLNTVTIPDQVQPSVPTEFRKMFDLSKSTFNNEQKEQLMNLLWEFKDIFLRPGEKLKCTDLIEFNINLSKDAIPFKARPYRSNPKVRQEVSRQVKEMLKDGIIRPSTSPFGSPVILVSKPDGSYRFVVDYRKLNSVTIKDNFPMQSIQDSLESLGSSEAKWFSSIDLLSGYHQVPIAEDSKQYTAFVTHGGLYEFNRLSFGLANAPACFNRLMTRVLQNLNWDIALVYLDDIIIFSKDFQTHLVNLKAIFNRLREANLTLKPSKCSFGQEKIRYLGHLVSKDGIEPLPDKCKAVEEFPRPKKVKDVRSFLGLTSYYRRHIKDYAKVAAPLNDLTKKDKLFHWTDSCEEAFQALKKKLVESPILGYPRYTEGYLLYTDSSEQAVGMVLSQIQDGQEVVISYGGKKLSASERRYSTTERECLAVILALKQFEAYLRGIHVTIITDHAALKWMLTQKEPKSRIARWVAFLQQFDYTIRHQPGKKIGHADGLSRREYDDSPDEVCILKPSAEEQQLNKEIDEVILPDVEEHSVNVADFNFRARRTRLKGKKVKVEERQVIRLPEIQWTKEKVRACQLADENCGPLIKYLEDGTLPEEKAQAREVVLSSEAYLLEDGILYHLLDCKSKLSKRQVDEIRVCLVVPKELKFDILTSVHGDLNSGHYGTQRTYTTLRLKYYWKGMFADCKNFVISCDLCNTRKNPVTPTKAPLQPLKPARIFERCAMDIVKMPLTPRGNKYILTFTEYCSRYVEAFPLQNTQAVTIARILVNEICFRYGAPQHLLSDLGQNLISEVVGETCKLFGITRLYTTPYHPATDGLLEKFHSTLTKNLSMYVSRCHSDWDLYLRGVVYSYNSSVCIDSTQYSPFFLMFGREPYYPLDTILPNVSEVRPISIREHVLSLAHARELAMHNIKERQDVIKKRYDKGAVEDPFEPGELVWIFFPEINISGSSRKLYHNYSGPYLLSEKISPTNFKVRQAHDMKPLRNPIHVNRMKRFHHRAIRPPTPDTLHQINNSETNEDLPELSDIIVGDRPQLQQPNIPVETNNEERRVAIPDISNEDEDIELPDPPVERQGLESGEDSSENTAEEYEINRIIHKKLGKDNKVLYLLDWKGYPASARTYEPEENLNEEAKKYVRTHDIPIVGRWTQ